MNEEQRIENKTELFRNAIDKAAKNLLEGENTLSTEDKILFVAKFWSHIADFFLQAVRIVKIGKGKESANLAIYLLKEVIKKLEEEE